MMLCRHINEVMGKPRGGLAGSGVGNEWACDPWSATCRVYIT